VHYPNIGDQLRKIVCGVEFPSRLQNFSIPSAWCSVSMTNATPSEEDRSKYTMIRIKFLTTMSFSKTVGSSKENRTDTYHLLVHLWQDLVIQRWLTKLH
jgi:hypothetical protein